MKVGNSKILMAVHCSGCGRRLTETLTAALVYCPRCGKWTRAERPREPEQQPLWPEAVVKAVAVHRMLEE